MKTDDLPESKNVVDRRGKLFKRPATLTEMADEAASEPQPEPGKPDPASPLAQQAGVDDIGKDG